MPDILAERLAIIGVGLIGGSLARRAHKTFARTVVLFDRDDAVRARARALGLGDEVADTLSEAVAGGGRRGGGDPPGARRHRDHTT